MPRLSQVLGVELLVGLAAATLWGRWMGLRLEEGLGLDSGVSG